MMHRTTSFGSSTREDWEICGWGGKNKRDSFNPNAGPGNYNPEMDVVLRKQANTKFGLSERPSMALRTLSPGPVGCLGGRSRRDGLFSPPHCPRSTSSTACSGRGRTGASSRVSTRTTGRR